MYIHDIFCALRYNNLTQIQENMTQTFMDGHNIYSVDMMIAYIRLQTPHIFHVKMEDFVGQLHKNIWGIPSKGIRYSPMSVITNPQSNQTEYNKILRANISFPIILSPRGDLIDGIHRVSKVYLKRASGEKGADDFQLRAVMFDEALMARFLISSSLDWNKVNNMKAFDFIELYSRRFAPRRTTHRPPAPLPMALTLANKGDQSVSEQTADISEQTADISEQTKIVSVSEQTETES